MTFISEFKNEIMGFEKEELVTAAKFWAQVIAGTAIVLVAAYNWFGPMMGIK